MRKILLYIIVIVGCLISCKHDIPHAEYISSCEPLPLSPRTGWQYALPDTGYSAPCFNPRNADEIVYLEHHFKNGETWLCRLDLTTKEKVYLLQGDFWSDPEWRGDGWIIFSLSDANIYKLKNDKNTLTKLTTNGDSHGPDFDSDHNRIFYYTYMTITDTAKPGGDTRRQRIGIKMDMEGDVIDTFSWWGNIGISLNDTVIIGNRLYDSNGEIFRLNLKSSTFKNIAQYDPNLGIGTGICQIDPKILLWSRKDGIFKIDLSSGTISLIEKTCNSNYYMNPTYAPQLNKVIWERKIKTPNGNLLKVESEFVMMNPDGTEKNVIKIP